VIIDSTRSKSEHIIKTFYMFQSKDYFMWWPIVIS